MPHNRAKSTHTVAINIPADGLMLAISESAGSDLTKENCTRAIEAYISRHLDAKPDILLLNVCYRRSITPSEVFDSYLYDVETDENGLAIRNENGETKKHLSPTGLGCSKYFDSFFTCARPLLERGIDAIAIAIKKIRETDCRVYLSLRMNDEHYTENAGVNAHFAMKNGGMHTIGKNGQTLDFSQTAVQNHFLEYTEELLSRYDVDGIELDWLRFTVALPEEKRGDFGILNDYMAKVRALLDRRNKALRLAVRLLPCEADNLKNGMDGAAWIGSGSADMLTIENFYIPTNYEPPVQGWRESIEAKSTSHRPYTLLCGSDWGVSCIPAHSLAISPALVRGFTAEALERGADGVYLFNFFEQNSKSSFEYAEENGHAILKNCFFERMAAARDPYRLPRRHVHIGDSTRRYPIALPSGTEYTFSYTKKSPAENGKIIVGLDSGAPVFASIKGVLDNICLQSERVLQGFEYIPKEKLHPNDFVYSPSQIAPFIRSAAFSIPCESEKTLFFTIHNTSSEAIRILWLEIETTA
jgi:hypothetical protein